MKHRTETEPYPPDSGVSGQAWACLVPIVGIIGLFIAGLVILLSMTSSLVSCSGRGTSPPSDDDMISHFKAHEREFTELRKMMATHPQLRGVSPDEVDLGLRASGLTAARIAHYRALMRKTGIKEADEKDWEYPHSVWFQTYYGGSIGTSDEKGYMYSRKPPDPLVDSLNGDEAIGQYTFRHIGGHWYLYRWYDP